MNIVIYGGQYGSEGKASAAEFWIKEAQKTSNKIAVIGENSPNSGHTCSLGANKNIPASSYFAEYILLGPDSVIDVEVLLKDWKAVGKPRLFIHEHAAILDPKLKKKEKNLIKRISSTGSGSGMARLSKFINRKPEAVIKNSKLKVPGKIKAI